MSELATLSPVELAKDCEELNTLDKALADCIKDGAPKLMCDYIHQFTPGLYSRTILMRKGSLLTTRIHRFTHQFIITKGLLEVWTKDLGWQTIVAPHIGITEAGTRRSLRIHEDTIWTTFHPTQAKTVDEAVAELTAEPDSLEAVK